MRAVIHTKYGPPEVAKLMEVGKPLPKANEVLVKVFASTVNRTDCGFRSAEYFISRFWSGLLRPKYQILGCEFAGEIEETGVNVKSFENGDKIFGYNDSKFGGHAEYLTIEESGALALMPENFSYEDIAPSTEGAHYALGNIRASKIKSGQNALVYGATGAIGSSAVPPEIF
jgi:NADPH:quinone reductase-like Zn-dependent oxidoreductase